MSSIRSYQSLGKLVTRLRDDLNDADLVLLYAYNRNRQDSPFDVAFKDAGKRKNKKNPSGTPDTCLFQCLHRGSCSSGKTILDGDSVRRSCNWIFEKCILNQFHSAMTGDNVSWIETIDLYL